MSEVVIDAICPKCGENLKVKADMPSTIDAPVVRSKLQPSSNILVYRISSKTIATFITEKARQYVPEVRVEVVPCYCETKKRHEYEPRRSYASFKIAFSDKIIDKGVDLGWYGKIGESSESCNIKPSMFKNIIEKYSYNPKDVKAWLDSYKNLEKLEIRHGMTEEYINDLNKFARPRRITANNGEAWIIFAAAPENIIKDMLTDPKTNMLPGRIEISNPYEVSEGGDVEYVVYLHPGEVTYNDNPHVRQILLGEEKPNKNKKKGW